MKSYAAGETIPLIEKTMGEVLAESAARNPGAMALVSRHQNLRLTCAELAAKVDETARGLWALGLRPGDRVGMWSPNCAEWVYLQFATALIGVVLVNVNPAYRSHELRYLLRKSGMKAIFLQERDARAEYLEVITKARQGHELPLRDAIILGGESWQAMLRCRELYPRVTVRNDEVANIQYTSGTTGSPKGVLLTHRNLVNNAYLIGRALRVRNNDSLCAPVPMYHCFGCVMSSLMCVVHGITLVMPAAQFDPLATIEAVAEERCTAIYGVPTMFIAEMEHPAFPRYDLTSLRTGIMAGAPCPIEVMKRVVSEMHCSELIVVYGQTESSPGITASDASDPLDLRVSTVGRVMPNTEVRIAAPDGGRTVDIGDRGELCTRGYLVMKGYDGEDEATKHAIDSDGWLHTGDLAVMRPDGYFQIRGRLKEMIIRGGENIYPREIEEFLHTHPDIADVYVLGVPDEKLGETVAAWVKLKSGAVLSTGELREFCRGKIAHFKIPQYVRFVDSFPMTVTGKIQKFRTREQEIEALGLAAASRIETP
jgi:fatty-acyl-CoA synthase